MNQLDWNIPLDRIEEQLDAVSSSFSRGESDDLAHSAHLLELMCKELAEWVAAHTDLNAPTQAQRSRALTLGERLLTLRQGLLQRAVFVDQALRQLVPSMGSESTTYSNAPALMPRQAYGMGLRSSGTFKSLQA